MCTAQALRRGAKGGHAHEGVVVDGAVSVLCQATEDK